MSSIERRATGGKPVWRVRFRLNGANKAITFTTEKGARDWRKLLDAAGPAAALAKLDAPESSNTRTLAEHIERHIVALTGVTDGTRRTYRAYLARDMADIGALPLDMLDREGVAAWVNRLAARGLSGKSIANRHGLLSSAMNTAITDKIVTDNPCQGMRLPRTDHVDKEMVFLSRDEFAILYGHIAPRFQPLVLTLVGTGMRFSEATALTIADVDLDGRTASVRQAWKMTGTAARQLGPPKSKRSRRTVVLPGPVVDSIRPLTIGRPSSALVFTNAHGGPIKQATFWRNTWAPAVQELAGDDVRIDKDKGGRKVRVVIKLGPGKHPRIHDLRHTFASWAISNGISMVVLQRSLGHESITTTIDRYGHLARADYDLLAEATSVNLPSLAINA